MIQPISPKQRAGRLGSAMLGAAVLIGVPGILLYQWLQDAAPYRVADSQASSNSSDSGLSSDNEAPQSPPKPTSPPESSSAKAPTVGQEEMEARKAARPALIGADGAAVEDANPATDEEGEQENPTQFAPMERAILRAADTDTSVYYYRTWTASDGAALEAVYLGRKGSDVLLRDTYGVEHAIALDRLSRSDQDLLQATWDDESAR